MRSIRVACLAVAVAVTGLVGCGTAPPLQGARPAAAPEQKYGLARSEAVARTDHTTLHLNESKSIVYFQNQGGGGLALGLLLGPLGVAANVKAIEGVTTADAEKLKGRIEVDPEAALQQAASAVGFPIQSAAGTGDVKVTPYVLVSKTNETTVHVSSILLFEGTGGQGKWVRRYQYQLPGRYTVADLSASAGPGSPGLQAASVAAYASLLKHVADEKDAAIALERRITFKSPYMTPRFEFELMGSLVGEKEGRVWVRTMSAVTAVDPSDIQYRVAKN